MIQAQIIKKAKTDMQKAVEHTRHEFGGIHTGKASPAMVENITADIYGSPTQIRAAAAISTPDSRTIAIMPFDKSTAGAIVKAIQVANIGLNPVMMGEKIHVPLPSLTKERREQLVKTCNGHAEQGRVAIRNVRREAMEAIKKAEKDKQLSEDDRKLAEKSIQTETDAAIKLVDEALKAKEKELLKV